MHHLTTSPFKKFIQVFSLVALALVFSACSSGELEPPPERINSGINDFVGDLPSWSSFSPSEADSNEASAEPESFEELVSDVTYECTTTPYSLTRTPEEIVMYSPNASVMWLGNLIQGKSYASGLGSLQELSIRQRAPLAISIDLLRGDNFRVIENPSLASVQSAIGELVDAAEQAGHKGGSSATYTMERTHSTEQASLNLGFSAHYLGAKARGDLEYENNASETTITAHFVQKLFTVSVELPQKPSDFFNAELTDGVLQAEIDAGNLGSDNLPVYIANISYGRILTFNFTSSYEEERVRAAISGSYEGIEGGASGYTEGELRDTLSTAKIEIASLGGDSANIRELIKTGNLKSYFEDDPSLTSARPISYQLNNLAPGNPIAKVTETTTYNIKECTARQEEAKKTGERIKITLERVVVHDACDSGFNGSNGEVYGNMSINGTQVWTLPEKSVSDGNSISINQSRTKNYYYSSSDRIRISGFLTDADTGNDDKIGIWNLNLNPYSTRGAKTSYSKPDCDATLYYRVEKLNDLFE